jgi:L-threonylcarbamoyladenylate synthase
MIEQEIDNAVKVLKNGGIIVYPTDTIWGIGCDATNEKAVKKIYALKKRLEEKTMIVLICKKESLEKFVENVPPIAYDLIESWEKPLTIVYDGAKNLASSLIRGDKSVAIRVSRDEYSRKLISKLGKPLISTSANRSGEKAPLFFKEIDKEILDGVDYVVNLYHDSMNEVKASTIIRLHHDGNFEVLRP